MSGDQTSEVEQLSEEKAKAEYAREKAEEREKNLEEKLRLTIEKLEEEMKKSAAKDAELRKLSPAKSDCMAEESITLEVEVARALGKGMIYSPYTAIGGLPCRIGFTITSSVLCRPYLFCNDSPPSECVSAKVCGTVTLGSDTSSWFGTFPVIFLPSAVSAYAPLVDYPQFVKNGRLTVQVHIKVIYCYKNVTTDFASPDPDFTDVTLIVGGKKFNANKMYLAHHAGYFKIAFCSGFAEKAKKEIERKDINAGEFEEMLRVIYPERKKVTADTVTGLLHMADFFDVHVLIRECTDFLLSTPELSLSEKLKLTQEFRLPELQDRLVEGSKIDELKRVINESSFPLLSETLQKSLFQKFFKLSK